MRKLTRTVQTFIVTRLACCDSPSEVARAVNDEFGLTVTRQLVQKYDPTREGKKPARHWVALFNDTRLRFLEDVRKIPVAHSAVRLRRLGRMAEHAEARGNYKLSADILRQCAEEVGGLLTNRRELTGVNGGPIVPTESLDDYSPAELAALALATLSAEEQTALLRELDAFRASNPESWASETEAAA